MVDLRQWMDKTIKELQKHAECDHCYGCKQLLKESFVQIYLDAMKARDAL